MTNYYTQPSTLGWYYSNNFTLEPNVAASAYPYSRSDFYRDGSGAGKRSAGVGGELKMGMGRESSSNSFPVRSELVRYFEMRNKINASIPLGELPSNLAERSLLSFNKDPNGSVALSITDLAGNLLMNARADANGILTVSSSFSMTTPPKNYKAIIKFGYLANTSAEDNIVGLAVRSSNQIEVYKNGNLFYSGAGDNFNLAISASNDNAEFVVQSANTFYYNYTKTNSYGPQSTVGNFPGLLEESPATTIQYFQLAYGAPVNISGTYKLIEMQSEQDITGSFASGNTLRAGYYKVISLPGTNVSVSYTQKYCDISYNFYNWENQLVATVAPNGVQAYLVSPGSYTNATNIPFIATFEHDGEGRMIAGTSTDGGRTEYIYRKDGKIRFSQNALQRNPSNAGTGYVEKYSFTNYDRYGRPIKSGEYLVPSGNAFSFQNLRTNTTVLESNSINGGLSGGTESQIISTFYDTPNSTGVSGYVQDGFFLKGAVSYTRHGNNYTWFNYDDLGRVTWIVKQVNGMSAKKTVNYSYDAQGKVSKVDYQKNVAAERFIHYYDYDADGRLVNVQTSRDDVNKIQHAKYYYYAHGALKRVELGDNLQGIDYIYTVDGSLKSINHSSGDPAKDPGKDGYGSSAYLPDAFGMQIEYFPNDYNRSGTSITSIATGQPNYYNGNVNGISWQSKKTAGNSAIETPSMYTYSYDPNYQLSAATWGGLILQRILSRQKVVSKNTN